MTSSALALHRLYYRAIEGCYRNSAVMLHETTEIEAPVHKIIIPEKDAYLSPTRYASHFSLSHITPRIDVDSTTGGMIHMAACEEDNGRCDIVGFGQTVERAVAPLAVFDHFGDFARGVVSFSGLMYFVNT